MTVFEELFYGENVPNHIMPETAEAERYENQLSQSRKKLAASLTKEQLDMLEEVETAYINIQTCHQCCSFAEGYKLAVKSIIESLK